MYTAPFYQYPLPRQPALYLEDLFVAADVRDFARLPPGIAKAPRWPPLDLTIVRRLAYLHMPRKCLENFLAKH